LPLCEAIVSNWPAIAALFQRSSIVRSTPTRHPQKARAVSPRHDRSELPKFQSYARAGCRAILRADIADFYPSVYTHAIIERARAIGHDFDLEHAIEDEE
jgi:hypothetical protein